MIKEYFRERPELISSPSYRDFSQAKENTFAFVVQEGWDKISRRYRAFAITPNNMIGFPEARKRSMQSLEENAKECAAKLYGFDVRNIEFNCAYLMVNGSSLPIRLDLTLRNSEADGIRKKMFVKQFDIARLLGLELYSLIGGIDQNYNFFFNEGIIAEDALEGKHEFELECSLIPNPTYKIERIRFDVISFYMGLDDLGKKDNYLITPDGRIKIIDFDVLDRRYTDAEKRFIQAQTSKELGISVEEYEKILKDQERLLRDRILQEKDRIDKLIGMVKVLEDKEMAEIGRYIGENTNQLLAKYR